MLAIQLTHHVGCEAATTNRVRTGYEMVVPHHTSETFACPARQDGVVEAIDDELKLVRIRYDATPVQTSGALKLPLTAAELEAHLHHKRPIFLIKPGSAEKTYPLGAVLAVSPSVNVRVAELIRFTDLSQVPGNERMVASERAALSKALADGRETAVLYVRLEPLPKTEPGVVDVFRFGETYTSVSGSHLRQDIVLNVKPGERVQKGDIVAYNAGFFEPDLDSRQVTWKHGVPCMVAFGELSSTLEDSCMITRDFGAKLTMAPAHVRPVVITNKTVLHQIVNIGDEVQTTDLLCVLEDGELDALTMTDDPDTVEFLAELNRKAPRAKYHGHIVELAMYYSCPIESMHPSVARLATQLYRHQMKTAAAAADGRYPERFPEPDLVPVGSKFRGIEFAEDTVVIMITISEELPCGTGDKLVLCSASKSIVGEVLEQVPSTESGVPLDMIFSAASIQNRIILSPLLQGVANRVLEKVEQDIVSMYFGT